MSLDLDATAIRVNGGPVALRAIIQRARALDQTAFVDQAIREEIVRQEADSLDISATRGEIQAAGNAFREKHKLLKADDVTKWLDQRGLSVTEWQLGLESDILEDKVTQTKFGAKVAQYFAEHKLDFETATISRIVIASEDLSYELALQLKEEGAPFESMARKHSSEKATASLGGYVGSVTRKQLGAAASSSVFGGKAGSVLGPIKVGKQFHIYRIEEIKPARLDDATRQRILETLFAEWLDEARSKANIEIPLYEGSREPAGVA